MKLLLEREIFTDKSTIGKLYIDGKYQCYTLEDKVRGEDEKIYGKTAIPAGKYSVIINMSNRFKVLMPLLLKVPGFEGVRIHSGNTDADTEGCILVGLNRADDFVGQSRIAFNMIFKKMQIAQHSDEQIEITIINKIHNA